MERSQAHVLYVKRFLNQLEWLLNDKPWWNWLLRRAKDAPAILLFPFPKLVESANSEGNHCAEKCTSRCKTERCLCLRVKVSDLSRQPLKPILPLAYFALLDNRTSSIIQLVLPSLTWSCFIRCGKHPYVSGSVEGSFNQWSSQPTIQGIQRLYSFSRTAFPGYTSRTVSLFLQSGRIETACILTISSASPKHLETLTLPVSDLWVLRKCKIWDEWLYEIILKKEPSFGEMGLHDLVPIFFFLKPLHLPWQWSWVKHKTNLEWLQLSTWYYNSRRVSFCVTVTSWKEPMWYSG